jgi:transposase
VRRYDGEYKLEAIRLAEEIGATKASKELGIPTGTLDTWIYKKRKGVLNIGSPTPKAALSLAEENKRLQEENRELKRTNEILKKAAVFFAQSQKK